MKLPIGLPSLPVNGIEPDGTELTLHRTSWGRWFGRVWDDNKLVDQTHPEASADDVLTTVSRNYPATSFTPEDV